VAVDCDTPRDMRRPQIVCVATGSGKELRAGFEYNGTVKLADGTVAISALQERPYLRVQPEARSARTAGSRARVVLAPVRLGKVEDFGQTLPAESSFRVDAEALSGRMRLRRGRVECRERERSSPAASRGAPRRSAPPGR
jgi:hypothetical protein